MLKGHAIIELTNVKTGQVEKYEEDNLITNAMSEYLNNKWTLDFGGISTLNNWHLPLTTKAMAGIALFEKSIEENANITYFPEDNRVVGFGGTIADEGLDSYWGARNLAESESYNTITKRVKHVWDFKTNQAIGTISCVGLIDGRQGNYYGDSLWHPHYSQRLDVSSYFSLDQKRQMIEWHDEQYICIINDTGKVFINTYNFDFNQIGLNEKLCHNDLISSIEVTMPKEMNYGACIWGSNDTHYYGLLPFYYSNFSGTTYTSKYVNHAYFWSSYAYLHVVQINKETFECVSYDLNMPNRVMPNNGFLVTNNYIILPFTTSNYYSGNFYNANNRSAYKNINKNQAIFINLTDFSVTVKNFIDNDGNAYSLLSGSNYSGTYGMYNGGFQAVELPNKTYMLNNLILNNDGYVIRNTAGPMMSSYNNAMPPNITSWNGYLYVSTCPFALSDSVFYNGSDWSYERIIHHTNKLILNKEKSVIIWMGANYSYNTCSSSSSKDRENLSVYIIPLYSQKLMTINNLETPIEKTSDKTMKITYVLTEVDEEASEI